MNEIRFSTRFKKDIKRYEHDDEKLKHLYDIVMSSVGLLFSVFVIHVIWKVKC